MKAGSQTILLKACSRCRGDLIYDPWEKQRLCLQCGHRLSREQERELLGLVRNERPHGGKKIAAPTPSPSRSQVGVTPLA